MKDDDKNMKRVMTEGVLAPLGTPVLHFKKIFKSIFGNPKEDGGVLKTVIDGSPAVSGLAVLGGLVAGGHFAGIPTFHLVDAATLPVVTAIPLIGPTVAPAAAWSAGALAGLVTTIAGTGAAITAGFAACIAAIGATAAVTGITAGVFKIGRNIKAGEFIYGVTPPPAPAVEPVKLPSSPPASTPEPAPRLDNNFAPAAKPETPPTADTQSSIHEKNLKKLDQILKKH